MAFAMFMLASDVFASLFICITLWRLSNRKGANIELTLIANVFACITVFALGWLIILSHGAVVPLALKPNWEWVAFALAILRSSSIWGLALHMVWIATRQSKDDRI